MNKNLLIGLVAGAVVIGGGYYFVANNSGVPTTDMSDQSAIQPADTTAKAGEFKGSITELAARGGSWKCTVDITTGQSVSSGVTYSSGGKVRGDFSTKVQGYGNVQSHMIADGQNVYTWSSVMTQGIKTKMAPEGSSASQTSGQGVDTNQPYSYNCQAWTPDMSLFVTPSDITFNAIGQ